MSNANTVKTGIIAKTIRDENERIVALAGTSVYYQVWEDFSRAQITIPGGMADLFVAREFVLDARTFDTV